MKYLVHVRPSEEITQRVIELRDSLGLKATPHDPHSTLLIGTLDESSEDSLIKNLESLCGNPVSVGFGELDKFDENSFVVRLQKTDPLIALHHAVIKAATLLEFRFNEKYFLENYNPHISVGYHDGRFALPQQNPFINERFDVRSFHLSRAKEQEPKSWEYVREFPISDQT